MWASQAGRQPEHACLTWSGPGLAILTLWLFTEQEDGRPPPHPSGVWTFPPLKECSGTPGRASKAALLPHRTSPGPASRPGGDPLNTEDAAQRGTPSLNTLLSVRIQGPEAKDTGPWRQSNGPCSLSTPAAHGSSRALELDGTGGRRGGWQWGSCDYAGKNPQFRCPWQRVRTLHSPPSMSCTHSVRAKSLPCTCS